MAIRKFLTAKFVKRANYERQARAHRETLDFLQHLTDSRAENFQDLWVLSETNYKAGGFFVEFGATNGVDTSNTWLLEKKYGWKGILAEPNPHYQDKLLENRNCFIDKRVVWNESGSTVEFLSMQEPYISVTKEDLVLQDNEKLRSAVLHELRTVSLGDLLRHYKAPKKIDFISIDVEGSEERILKAFFKEGEYEVALLSVEHNWLDKSGSLLKLILSQGYVNVFGEHSSRDYWFRKI